MTVFRSMLIVTVLGLFCACGQGPGADTARNTDTAPAAAPEPSPAASVDLLAQGRKLYTDNCAGCHKEDGKGGTITIEGKSFDPDDLTAKKIKDLPDDRIYRYIHNGIEDEGMPAFKDKLSEAEIREVVRYLRTEIQNMPDPNATSLR